MIRAVISLLAAHLAVGSLVITALLALRNRLPDPFLRFCAAASTLSAAIAWMVGTDNASLAYGIVAAVSALWYLWLRRRGGESPLPVLAAAAVALGALAAECLDNASAGWLLCFAGSLGSSLLLGSVAVSMVLGHWYLVDTRLSIAPLRHGALVFAAAVAVRWLTVVTALSREGWEVVQVTRAADVFYSTLGLFFLFRAITGLVAPLLLTGLIWQTVKMRSTQSATGLLYVALVLVLFGELIAQFLTVATGYPL